jgi:hypothetical protein
LRPIDACIADIVGVLNMNGVPTDGSCCGHGEEPGSILLTDGRELRVHFPEGYEYEHKRPLAGEELVRAFATLFDDDPNAPPMTDEEIDEFLRDTGHDPDEVGRKMARVAEEAYQREVAKVQDLTNSTE